MNKKSPIALTKEGQASLTISGAEIAHICCVVGGVFMAELVAKCSHIPHVVDKTTDVIGNVDAIIIATDIGDNTRGFATPFVSNAASDRALIKAGCSAEGRALSLHRKGGK